MFHYSIMFLFIVCFTDRTRLNKPVDDLYEMHCDCGRRKTDRLSEMDCEESARLEAQQQELLFYVSLNFQRIHDLTISI